MGLYVDPKGQTKENWLCEYSSTPPLETAPVWQDAWAKEALPVCLVNNGQFTVAGIAHCPKQLAAFTRPDDMRPKLFFVVPIVELRKVCPLIDLAMAEAGVLDPAVAAQLIEDFDSKEAARLNSGSEED